MRYASLGGGKRLRPFLAVETAALFGVPRAQALMAGAALEMRALLFAGARRPAGDGQRRSAPRPADRAQGIRRGDRDPGRRRAADLRLRHARRGPRPIPTPTCGSRWCTGSRAPPASAAWSAARCSISPPRAASATSDTPQGEKDVLTLQAMKTGALLSFCCVAGAILGNAPPAQARRASNRYGQVLGQAFQIADDLLDVEGDAATVGKATGKDAAHGKATLVDLLGVAGARTRLAAAGGGCRSRAGAVRRRRRDPARTPRISSPSGAPSGDPMSPKAKRPAYLLRVGMAHRRLIDLRRHRPRHDARACRQPIRSRAC